MAVMRHGEPSLDATLARLGVAFLPTWLIDDVTGHYGSARIFAVFSTPAPRPAYLTARP
jgi:hypothetical protein